MDIETAIKYALNGEAMLFAGAGFSSNVKNQDKSSFKRGKELSYLLCRKLGLNEIDNLGYVSKKFIKDKGANELITLLQREYISSEVLELHKDIMEINWKRIYTTNYDDVIEKASDTIGKARIPVTLSKPPEECINESNLIVHLNGYIKELTPKKLENEFKLSRESYINDDFTDSKWATLFKNDIDNSKAIFFVGYSLNYDLDIQRLLISNKKIKEKCFFITHEKVDEISIDAMEDFGSVEKIGVEGFSNKINEITKDYEPIRLLEYIYNCFVRRVGDTNSLEKVKDQDVLDLFIKGKLLFSHIFNFGDHKKNYVINRTILNNIINELENDIDLAIIHSDLGNGKTVFTETIIAELLKKGAEVFVLNNQNGNYSEEIEEISKIKEKKYIIIENYNLYFDVIEQFQVYNTNNMKFIFTCRSFVNDNFYLKLIQTLGVDDAKVGLYSLNKLQSNELKALITIFDEYHLWGHQATLNTKAKLKLLKENFNGNFRGILLGLLRSEVIQKKLKEILQVLEENEDIKDIIFTTFINEIVKLDLKLEDIIILLNKTTISAQITKNPAVNELVNIDQDEINVKSSVLAQYILNDQKNSSRVVDLLIHLMTQADKKDLGQYYNLQRLLVAFSNIRLLLNNKDNNFPNYIVKFYENVKNLKFNKENHFFWLQYAIARLDLKQYSEAKLYFENAYAYVEKKSIDSYQIDTHYARFLLENELFNNSANDLDFSKFIHAHNLIYENRNKPDHLHYPLKQAKYYYDYYLKFYDLLSEGEKSTFILYCHQILKKIDDYRNAISRNENTEHFMVRKTETKIKKILTNVRSHPVMQ
jgi:SIR2-like domain/Type III restriction enzyme, res subunit